MKYSLHKCTVVNSRARLAVMYMSSPGIMGSDVTMPHRMSY